MKKNLALAGQNIENFYCHIRHDNEKVKLTTLTVQRTETLPLANNLTQVSGGALSLGSGLGCFAMAEGRDSPISLIAITRNLYEVPARNPKKTLPAIKSCLLKMADNDKGKVAARKTTSFKRRRMNI